MIRAAIPLLPLPDPLSSSWPTWRSVSSSPLPQPMPMQQLVQLPRLLAAASPALPRRTLRSVLLPALLACAGCAPAADSGLGAHAWQAPAGRLDFDWRLSGDRQVAPLQAFDDGRSVWLQFAPGQPLPAILAQQGDTQVPVAYVRRDPYIVVEGRWPALAFRGGRLQARAERTGAIAAGGIAGSHGFVPAQAASDSVADVPAVAAVNGSADGAPRAAIATATATPTSAPPSALGATAPVRVFTATPEDGNMRRALARWAAASGWTFAAEHWAVDVDIPLAGAASFGTDFKAAVRALMGSTEMGDHPLQPCFYSNRVLRIVAVAQPCDRSAARMAAPASVDRAHPFGAIARGAA